MRRTERIDEILAKIREEWIKIPDCRLGQLLVTKFRYPDNLLYGQEDDKFGVEVFDPNQPNEFEEFIKKVMSGIYPPLSKEECLMVARILKNKAEILETHKESTWFHELRNIPITLYGQEITFKKDADLQWIKKVAAWFERCGGLVPAPGIQGEE